MTWGANPFWSSLAPSLFVRVRHAVEHVLVANLACRSRNRWRPGCSSLVMDESY